MSSMKKVTKNNLLVLVEWKKEYLQKQEKGIKDEELLSKINDYIDNSINKDSTYYRKLLDYNFDSETLSFLIS